MAVARTTFLDKGEEDLIHAQSLKTLNEIGVMIHSESVLEMLEKSGADVDHKRRIVKIPENMVEEALKTAPKQIEYHARDPKHNFNLPAENFPYTATNGLAIHIADLETGEEHSSTREDIASFIRLGDALDQVDYLWTSLTATDVPAKVHAIHELWVAIQNTTKHVESVAFTSAIDARKQVELASLIVGGEDELRKRPIISVIVCTISPLTFEKVSIEAQVEFAKAGIPIVSMSMSQSGMSCPVTVAGTITNVNTENLASLVITQFAAPGAPHIYCSESAPVDMNTGMFNYSAPEMTQISIGTGQMAKRYGLPCMVADWGANMDIKPGISYPASDLCGGSMAAMASTDLAAGLGCTDHAKGCSYEQLVIDAYLWENFRTYLRKFTINEETIALDVVKEVGHGNTFLTHHHTMKNFKTELALRDKKKLAWEATLSSKMVPEAREVAKKFLREHEVPQIDRDIIKQGDALITEYEKTILK